MRRHTLCCGLACVGLLQPTSATAQSRGPSRAIDAASSLASSVQAGFPIRGLSVDNDLLLVGRDISGVLEAFTRDGRPIWKRRLPNWIHNAPLHAGDLVVVSYGDNFPVFRGTRIERVGRRVGGVIAFRASDGEQVWRHDVQGAVMTNLVLRGDTLLATTGERRLLALDLRSGKELWHLDLGGISSMANPIMHRSDVIVGIAEPQGMVVVDLGRRAIRWRTLLGENLRGAGDVTPVVGDDVIITTTNELLGRKDFMKRDVVPYWAAKLAMRLGWRQHEALSRQWIIGLERQGGGERWRHSVGVGYHRELNRAGTPMPLADGVVFSSFVTNTVYRFTNEGNALWRRRLPGRAAKGNVAIVGNVAYAALDDGRVAALDLETGRSIQVLPSRGRVGFFAPLVCGRNLLYPVESGRIASQDISAPPSNSSACRRSPR